MKVFDNVSVALTFMAITTIITADSNPMGWKNWTEENIVTLFRSYGENLCARADVCFNNRSTQARILKSSSLPSCCDGLFYLCIKKYVKEVTCANTFYHGLTMLRSCIHYTATKRLNALYAFHLFICIFSLYNTKHNIHITKLNSNSRLY